MQQLTALNAPGNLFASDKLSKEIKRALKVTEEKRVSVPQLHDGLVRERAEMALENVGRYLKQVCKSA